MAKYLILNILFIHDKNVVFYTIAHFLSDLAHKFLPRILRK